MPREAALLGAHLDDSVSQNPSSSGLSAFYADGHFRGEGGNGAYRLFSDGLRIAVLARLARSTYYPRNAHDSNS